LAEHSLAPAVGFDGDLFRGCCVAEVAWIIVAGIFALIVVFLFFDKQ
jgi:hypothetical protein